MSFNKYIIIKVDFLVNLINNIIGGINMNEILHTPWGNARINSEGYYRITSKKEDNYKKFLHRLIWEDFYGCKIPDGYIIHHKNGNKLDNCILNLQLMRNSDHSKLHNSGENHPFFNIKRPEHSKKMSGENHPNYNKTLPEEIKQKISKSKTGIPHSEEAKLKMSKSRNTTGYYRVSKKKDKTCKQGFLWQYRYYEKGKQKSIKRISIKKLEEEVKARGLEWRQL